MVKSLLMLIIFFSWIAPSSEYKNEVTIGVGFLRPKGTKLGPLKHFELELTKEIFKEMGIRPRFLHFELKDVAKKFFNHEIEAALTLKVGLGGGIYYSDDYIVYQNVAISLEDSPVKVNQISDLENYSILAFQNASKYLGREYKALAEEHKNYLEILDQSVQVKKFLNKDYQVFIGDIDIFNFYKKELEREKPKASFKTFKIFTPSNYKMGFRSKKLRDLYNKKLESIKASGRYLELKQRSIKLTSN
tara:strand:- start:114001 stop:114741 length:741 start_codon:yes stop_codon:yes gene_type:complete